MPSANTATTSLSIIIAASLLAACGNGEAAPTTNDISGNSSAQVRPGRAWSAPRNDAATRSEAAIEVLAGVSAARQAIAKRDLNAALARVDAAAAALGRTGTEPLIPIYSELSQTSFLGPVEKAQGKVKGAKASVSPAVAVNAVTTGYSRVLLDRSVSGSQLSAARTALARGDMASADKNLLAIERSVVLESAAARMPMARARENLALASAAAKRGDWAEMKTQLTAASKGLSDYGRTAPVADMADVKLLASQIDQYAARTGQGHEDAAATINRWWVQVANLNDVSH